MSEAPFNDCKDCQRLTAELEQVNARLDKYGDGVDWIERAMKAEANLEETQDELEQVKAEASEATEYLRWALEWIDSVPDDTLLPAMPEFDREDVDEFLSKQEGK